MDCFVLCGCHKEKVSQVNQESHGFPPEYELDLGCHETHRMEDHTRSNPYQVGQPKLKLLLASSGAEVIYTTWAAAALITSSISLAVMDCLDNTGSHRVDGKGGGWYSFNPRAR